MFEDEARKKSDELKSRGFEAGETVHTFIPEFDLDDVKKSLFESTYSSPQSVEVVVCGGAVELGVVVTTISATYLAHAHSDDDSPLGCYKYPEWKLEGWVLKSGFDPYPELVRVRMYIQANSGSEGVFDSAYIQRIPSNPDPDGITYLS